MLIGIDGNEANVEKRVGVSVYTTRLLEYFQKQADEDLQFIVYLRDEPRYDLPKQKVHFRYKVVPGPFLWSQIMLPLYLRFSKKKPNVFFAPAHYIPRNCPVPTVVTIHDIAYEYYPEEFKKADLFKLKSWTEYAIEHSKKVITVSENTRQDVVKFYKTDLRKLQVIYNGFSKKVDSKELHQQNTLSHINPKILSQDYILYVGTIQPRKNIELLINAFKMLVDEGSDLKLVIAGKKGWLYDEILNRAKALHIEDKVSFTGFIPDSEIADLYKNARAFILPSLYEGFGIPILEAMYYNCPVIASNVSSIPEIGKDACLYFNPKDTVELRDKIKELLGNDVLRRSLIKKGQERVENFSWEKCGKETLELLKLVSTS